MTARDEILALTPDTKILQEGQRDAIERFRAEVAKQKDEEISELRSVIERVRGLADSPHVTHDADGYAVVRVADLKKRLEGGKA